MTEKETCEQCVYKKLCYLEGVPEECKNFVKWRRPSNMRKRRTRETIANASQVLTNTRTFAKKDENNFSVEYTISGAILATLCDISMTLGMIADELREKNEENNVDLAKWMNTENPEEQQNDV